MEIILPFVLALTVLFMALTGANQALAANADGYRNWLMWVVGCFVAGVAAWFLVLLWAL